MAHFDRKRRSAGTLKEPSAIKPKAELLVGMLRQMPLPSSAKGCGWGYGIGSALVFVAYPKFLVEIPENALWTRDFYFHFPSCIVYVPAVHAMCRRSSAL